MRIDDIMKLTGASKATIYRWMERHPTIASDDPSSAAGFDDGVLGSPFPKPERKEGRAVFWNEDQVHQWWQANSNYLGRHPEESNVIELPYARYRAAMSHPVDSYEDEDGNQVIDDPIASVTRYERHGEQARVWFADATDALLFKIKFR